MSSRITLIYFADFTAAHGVVLQRVALTDGTVPVVGDDAVELSVLSTRSSFAPTSDGRQLASYVATPPGSSASPLTGTALAMSVASFVGVFSLLI